MSHGYSSINMTKRVLLVSKYNPIKMKTDSYCGNKVDYSDQIKLNAEIPGRTELFDVIPPGGRNKHVRHQDKQKIGLG